MKAAQQMLDTIYEGMPPRPDGTEVDIGHFWGSGVYVRRSRVPTGGVVRMHVHAYDHLSIVGAGRGILITDDGPKRVDAGDVIEVKAGKRHAFVAEADTIWLCVHSTLEGEAKDLYGPRTAP